MIRKGVPPFLLFFSSSSQGLLAFGSHRASFVTTVSLLEPFFGPRYGWEQERDDGWT